jgi:hypothetical protein
MQEQLATHEEEGEIMQSPTNEQEPTEGVVFEKFSCT